MKHHYLDIANFSLMADHHSSKKIRSLRDRKERKLYSDDWMTGEDDELDGKRGFNLEDKILSDKYNESAVREMHGSDLTLAYLQRAGFNTPILIREKSDLGLKVPPADAFTVKHVKQLVGNKRQLEVMDVNTQKNHVMSMKEWIRYYNNPNKDSLLNVISLEFSHTPLDKYVQSPTIVRELDWVDCVWPPHLKESQTEATNALDKMMYPKVQKYCLMSVKGCYTDFHIDFGGTSVWYHILKGEKIFWLIPPLEKNIEAYEKWVLSGKQSDIFFGDTVEKCSRVRLVAGNTFFIPSGWIHAVYTPTDSLVFGGNFLHSLGISQQIRIVKVEDNTRVHQKYRYPFFTEMLWYVLQKYVLVLLGINHLNLPDTVRPVMDYQLPSRHFHLTQEEIHGLKTIVFYLHNLPSNKKNLPEIIKDAVVLIQDVRSILKLHCNDSRELAVTGINILYGNELRRRDYDHVSVKLENQRIAMYTLNNGTQHNNNQHALKTSPRNSQKNGGGPRRRRTRCKKCEACQRSDCGECSFCLDMVKFGGPGRAKQTCVMRQCLQPMLPVTAACATCGLDGWGQQPVIPIQKTPRDTPSSLMECSVCYEIAHPDCYQRTCPGMEGVMNEDLPNSWECPKCCKDGKNREYRPRHFRARQKSSEVRRMSFSSDACAGQDMSDRGEQIEVDSESRDSEGFSRPASPRNTPESKKIKLEKDCSSPIDSKPTYFMDYNHSIKHSRSSEDISSSIEPRKPALRTQLAQQLTGGTSKVLKRPAYVVRPANTSRNHVTIKDGNRALERSVMVPVFRYLTPVELVECALVCRAWARFSLDPSLWRRMDLSHKRLTAAHLAGIARRQPETLVLDWTNIAKKQLGWLISRLPQLRELSIQGCSWAGVSALRTCVCPPLHSLDLSFVSGMNDSSLRDILSPPPDSRPGLIDSKSRLRHLRCLKVAGCDVSDVSLRYITQHLPKLSILDLSSCGRVTDAGVAQLATPSAPTVVNLTTLDLSNCRAITEVALEHLAKCTALTRLNLAHTPLISSQSVAKFRTQRENDVHIIGKV